MTLASPGAREQGKVLRLVLFLWSPQFPSAMACSPPQWPLFSQTHPLKHPPWKFHRNTHTLLLGPITMQNYAHPNQLFSKTKGTVYLARKCSMLLIFQVVSVCRSSNWTKKLETISLGHKSMICQKKHRDGCYPHHVLHHDRKTAQMFWRIRSRWTFLDDFDLENLTVSSSLMLNKSNWAQWNHILCVISFNNTN